MKENFRSKKGITLIALIITIIILVILAAVSIRAVYEMEIVGHAINGTQQYAERTKEENQMLGDTRNIINNALVKLNDIRSRDNAGESSRAEEERKVPEELKKYVMGVEKTGRAISEIFANGAFKAGTEADIADANTTVLYMNKMLDSNYLDTDYRYYLYAKYQDIGYRISITKNASTSNAEKTTGVEVVYVPNGIEGQIKKYSIDGTETPTDWLVLYDNGNTVDITPIALGTGEKWTYTLGCDSAGTIVDPNAVGSTHLEKAQWSYEHMVESLNAKCDDLVDNSTALKVRSIGTQFDLKDTTEKYSSTRLTTWPTSNAGVYNGVGQVGDMNGEQDVVRMSFFSPGGAYQEFGYAKAGDADYWIASRDVHDYSSAVGFRARYVSSYGNAFNDYSLWSVSSSGSNTYAKARRVRPVVRVEKSNLSSS